MAPVLRQLLCGRLLACDASPTDNVTESFRAADWFAPSGSGIAMEVVGGSLRINKTGSASGSLRRIPLRVLAARRAVFIQAIYSGIGGVGGSVGIAALMENADPASDWLTAFQSTTTNGEQVLREYDAAAQVQQDQTATGAVAVPSRISMFVEGTNAKAFFHGSSLEKSLTGLTIPDGVPGLFTSSGSTSAYTRDFSLYAVMSSHKVRVIGPSVGNWTANIKDAGGTVLASAAAVGGVAEIDCFAARLQFPNGTRLEIYNDDTASIEVTLDPTRRVWGGDLYAWYPSAPSPVGGVLTRDVLGRLSAFNEAPTSGADELFSLSDWAENGAGSLSLSSQRLRFTNGSGDGDVVIREVGSDADGPDCYVQALLAAASGGGTLFTGLGARLSDEAAGSADFVINRAAFSASASWGLVERAEPTTIQTDLATQASALSAPTRVALECIGSEARGFLFGRGLRSQLSGITITAPFAGLWKGGGNPGDTRDWSAFYRMRSATLQVSGGAGAGFLACVYDASDQLLASAQSDAGVASLDFLAERVRHPNAVRLDIILLSTAGLVPSYSETPSETLWGGDEWSFAPIPDAPGTPTLIDAAPSGLTIGWSAVSGATSYKLFRATSSGGPYTEVFEGSALSFIDAPLTPETTYFYRVQACNASGCSGDSGTLEATTDSAAFAPCSLLLEVFEADGETVAWEVSTDREHPLPYLDLPSNYGAREVDPVAGAATIATIDVSVRDVPQIPGDQDSGYVTERLGSIYGRRCRLQRYVNDLVGFVLVADGPASAPRLNGDYSSYSWTIRDARETERKLRPFSQGGSTSLAPPGPLEDWGATDDGPLLPAAVPLVGTVAESSFGSFLVNGVPWRSSFVLIPYTLTPSGSTFVVNDLPARAVLDPYSSSNPDKSILALHEPNQGTIYGDRFGWPNLDVLWRPEGSTDPFNVSRPTFPYGGAGQSVAECISIGGARINNVNNLRFFIGGVLLWTAPFADGRPDGMPLPGESIEFLVRYRGAPSANRPYYFEGTLGELLGRLYDRSLELPGATGGDVYDPLGLEPIEQGTPIAVDQARLDLLDTPVLLRQTTPVTDGRDWAEKNLYAPSGWAPTFDPDGRISPSTRARPSAVTLPAVTNANAQPAPDWNAGERVVTEVRYRSKRYYVPEDPATAVGKDGLATREVEVIYRDLAQAARHNEQLEEFDASAFSAAGGEDGEALVAGAETVNILAAAANAEVLGRYSNGAPAIVVKLRRSVFGELREGDFVPVQLSWFPGTTRRGLNWDAAQVLSIEQTDCEWITCLIESCPVAPEPGFYDNGAVLSDVPGAGLGYQLGRYLGGDYPEGV